MANRSLVAVAGGTAALALALTGCVVESGSTGTAGTTAGSGGAASGSITVACGAMEEVCDAWTKAFTAETGIQASFVRLSSGETVARLAATKSAPEFDVWHGGPADGFGAASEQDLIQPYVSPNAAAIPEKYKDADGTWTGVYVGTLGFCSNKAVLDELGLGLPIRGSRCSTPSSSRRCRRRTRRPRALRSPPCGPRSPVSAARTPPSTT